METILVTEQSQEFSLNEVSDFSFSIGIMILRGMLPPPHRKEKSLKINKHTKDSVEWNGTFYAQFNTQ